VSAIIYRVLVSKLVPGGEGGGESREWLSWKGKVKIRTLPNQGCGIHILPNLNLPATRRLDDLSFGMLSGQECANCRTHSHGKFRFLSGRLGAFLPMTSAFV